MKFSARAESTPPSPIRSLETLARKAEAQGTEVLRINIGQPDIESPEVFRKSLAEFSDPVIRYEASEGMPILREAWAKNFSEQTGVSVSADEVLITMGASEGLVFAFWTCCDPGDEVLVLDPTYANYLGFAAITGVHLVGVATELAEGFASPKRERLEQACSPKTKAILLCSPNNPTGAVLSDSELDSLLEFARERGLFVISDETYRDVILEGAKSSTALSRAKDVSQLLVIESVSKRYSLCGARIGAMIIRDQRMRECILSIAQARLSAPSAEQYAVAKMLNALPKDFLIGVSESYRERRDAFCNAIAEIEGVAVHPAHGGFYVLVELPVTDSEAFARFLLEDFSHEGQTVFVSPAAGFYIGDDRGHNQVRAAFVLEESKLKRAAELIGLGLQAFKDYGSASQS